MPESQLATKRKDIRAVRGFEQFYQVDAGGSIYRLWRMTSDGRALEPRELKGSRGRYIQVTLCGLNRSYVQKGVHIIVCEAFHGSAPSDQHEPNHKDGNKHNNAADNLEWVTRAENQRHAADIGLKPHGEKSHLAKLTLVAVREIRAFLATGRFSQKQIATRFGVAQSTICKINTEKKWRNDQ